jgi:hypothetical protein
MLRSALETMVCALRPAGGADFPVGAQQVVAVRVLAPHRANDAYIRYANPFKRRAAG